MFMLSICVFYCYSIVTWFWTKVPFVVTQDKVVQKMVEMANIQPKSTVYDLGSGNGKVLFAVEKQYKKSADFLIGYELIRPLVWFARFRNALRGDRCRFECRNFFSVDLSKADIVFTYLWPSVMDKFYTEKWPELKTGCRVISHDFKIKDLEPVAFEQIGKDKIYMYEK